jgi:hypothetical protein
MVNGKASGKQRGWVRGSRLARTKTQVEMLQKHGVHPIYSADPKVDGTMEATLDVLLKSLRPGDEVWVTSLARLVTKRADLRRAVDAIHNKECVIIEAASERRSDRDGALMALDAADELMGETRKLTPEQAQKFGAKGAAANVQRIMEKYVNRRMQTLDATKIWTDPDLAPLSNHAVLRRMPGWSQRMAYRHIGPRGLAKGRPRSDGSLSERSRPGFIYFLQNGRRKIIKIGYTRDHGGRVSSLQNANPDELKVLATIRGTRMAEAELHKRFSKFNVRGEWFRLEGDLAKYVAGLTAALKE